MSHARPVLVALAAAIVGVSLGFLAARFLLHGGEGGDVVAEAREEAAAIARGAQAEAVVLATDAETEGREEIVELRDTEERLIGQAHELLARREERAAGHAAALAEADTAAAARLAAVAERERELAERGAAVAAVRAESERHAGAVRGELERHAGATAAAVRDATVNAWVEEARATAQQRLRIINQGILAEELEREAKRLVGTAIQRYAGHYLTERLLSNVPLLPEVAARLTENEGAFLRIVEEAWGRTCRCSRATRRSTSTAATASPAESSAASSPSSPRPACPRTASRAAGIEGIAQALDRELTDLGRRAFNELSLGKAHPEIVKLVGRLNYPAPATPRTGGSARWSRRRSSPG